MAAAVGLAPVIDARCRILVLGSFPGVASLQAAAYYAHPRNQFWPLVGTVIGVDLPALPYPQRLDALLAAGIGLWDVIGACSRRGSLDAAIRDAQSNDLAAFCAQWPALVRVCFNGRTAGRAAAQLDASGLDLYHLPSTSPAHAGMPFAAKLAHWRDALTR